MKPFRIAYLIFFPFAVISFFSVNISPPAFSGFAGLFSFAILPCLIINLTFLIYFLIRKRLKWIIASILLFLIGYKHVVSSFSLSINSQEGIKVLNSNVRIFNYYSQNKNNNFESSKEMINWIASNDADILILQEYYNVETSDVWAATSKIKKHFPYHYLKIALTNRINGEFGQVIFSKHPIINKGVVPYDNKTFNQTIFVDIKIMDDTIRVYNVHLQSMAIEERKLFKENTDDKQLKNKLLTTTKKLERGFTLREQQVHNIIQHIQSSPYPVILGADMNDTPYSYSYNEIKKVLTNSFEEKGNGFGFTFNGKMFFLRIDNLFASDDFTTNSFNVHREIPFSDHFPISSTYSLNK